MPNNSSKTLNEKSGDEPSNGSNVDIQIDVADAAWHGLEDLESVVTKAIMSALRTLEGSIVPLELSCLLTSDEESHRFNSKYRGKETPTNVLSFPSMEREDMDAAIMASKAGGPPVMLGDLLLAHGVVAHEAQEQGKTFGNHLSHLLVHGVLHLVGFDHIGDEEAQTMEQLECDILAGLGIKDPYNSDLVRQ